MIESKKLWMYSTVGLAAILAVGFSFPQAFAHVTNSLSHNVTHILAALGALQTDVDDIQSDLDGLQGDVGDIGSNIDTLGQKAITVSVLLPEGDSLEILPLDNTNNIMYTGHVNGIISLSAVENTNVQLNCALHIDNAPILTMVRLDSQDPVAFQAVEVDADFTCTSLRLDFNGENTNGIQANLAISYTEIEGIDEVNDSPI